MRSDRIRKHLISHGVANMNTFGYPHCNSKNILTDPIYSAFFVGMLESAKDEAANQERQDAEIDSVINGMIAEIKGQEVAAR